MAGYWNDVVTRIFPKAEQISEDWAARTVTFELNEVTGGPTITFAQLEQLSARLGTSDISASTRPDVRYLNDGGGGVYIRVQAKAVSFPSPS